MPSDPKNPMLGDLHIDASEVASFIRDLPHGGLQGKRTEHDGYKDVVAEIIANQGDWGSKAGVTQSDFDEFMLANERVDLIDKYLGATEKLAELLGETRGYTVDQRERSISAIAQGVDQRAKAMGAAGAELLAKYDKTRAYRSAVAQKGVKTRMKNAEAKDGGVPADPTPADEG